MREAAADASCALMPRVWEKHSWRVEKNLLALPAARTCASYERMRNRLSLLVTILLSLVFPGALRAEG